MKNLFSSSTGQYFPLDILPARLCFSYRALTCTYRLGKLQMKCPSLDQYRCLNADLNASSVVMTDFKRAAFLPRILPESSSFSGLIENKQITWDWSVNLMGWKSLLPVFNLIMLRICSEIN